MELALVDYWVEWWVVNWVGWWALKLVEKLVVKMACMLVLRVVEQLGFQSVARSDKTLVALMVRMWERQMVA